MVKIADLLAMETKKVKTAPRRPWCWCMQLWAGDRETRYEIARRAFSPSKAERFAGPTFDRDE
jgi:hypothetical protein